MFWYFCCWSLLGYVVVRFALFRRFYFSRWLLDLTVVSYLCCVFVLRLLFDFDDCVGLWKLLFKYFVW